MTAPQPTNAASAFAATVGRYFTVVSVVPSLLLVAFVGVLAGSGAWRREPDLGEGIRALTDLSLGGTFALVLAALALGVVLHPLQFTLVQFLEGYWGSNPFWTRLREDRIRYHVQRCAALDRQMGDEDDILDLHKKAAQKSRASAGSDSPPTRPPGYLDDEDLATHHSARTEAQRRLSIYPADTRHVMPTRLGNALRAAETTVGAATGLSIITFAPHLMMLAPREQADYVNDQRTTLDLAIRSCLVCMLGFLAAVVFLWPHGLWLLVALVPLGLAWLCYRGSVTAAQEYGSALRMLLDLNRFALYEHMRLPLPDTTADERRLVERLRELSSDPDSQASVDYRQPVPCQDLLTKLTAGIGGHAAVPKDMR